MKKMSKRKPNLTDREKVVLLEVYEKRKVISKAKFSSSITSGDKNRAWQEIANIVQKKMGQYMCYRKNRVFFASSEPKTNW